MHKKKLRLFPICLSILIGLSWAVLLGASTTSSENSYDMDADGFVVYTVTEKDINPHTGLIELDGSKIAGALRSRQWSGKSNWMPGQTETGKIKIVNQTPYTLKLADWNCSVGNVYEAGNIVAPVSPLRNELVYEGTTGSGAKGRDGQLIPIGLTPFRGANAAICALYGKNASAITFEDLIQVEQTIRQKFADSTNITTYAQYLCQYYGVDTLAQLTPRQKSAVLDPSSFFVRKLGDVSILQDERAQRFGYYDGSVYVYHETDREVVELGYNFYFENLYAFSFSTPLTDSNMTDYTLYAYMDKTSKAYQQADALLKQINLAPGEAYTIDTLNYHVSGPLMGNAYSNRGVPGFLEFDLVLEPITIDGMAFVDMNKDGLYVGDVDAVLENISVTLYKIEGGTAKAVMQTNTDAHGYYNFGEQPSGVQYYLEARLPKGYTLIPTGTENNANHFVEQNQVIRTDLFEGKQGHYMFNVGVEEAKIVPTPSPSQTPPPQPIVKTGETSSMWPFILLLSGCVVSITIVLLFKRGRHVH